MDTLLSNVLGISRKSEILFLIIITLCINLFDMSYLDLTKNLSEIWATTIDDEKFGEVAQLLIRNLLCAIEIIRTSTYHVYMLTLMLLLWPVLAGGKALMIIPWLIVSVIKNFGVASISFGTGLSICTVYGLCRPACLTFFVTQLFDLAPSIYMWFIVFRFYQCLMKRKPMRTVLPMKSIENEIDIAVRRRKTRSMSNENTLRKQIEETKAIDRICAGSSAVVVDEIFKKYEIADIKSSRSLDSLLFLLSSETETDEIEDDSPIEENLTAPEKAMKLLGITQEELHLMKSHRDLNTSENTPTYLLSTHPKSYRMLDTRSNLNKSKLLTETSMYKPHTKEIRPTKSELKTPKDFLSLKNLSDFKQNEVDLGLKSCTTTKEESVQINIKVTVNDKETHEVRNCLNGDSDNSMDSIEKRVYFDAVCQVSTLSRKFLSSLSRPSTSSVVRSYLVRPQTTSGCGREFNANYCQPRTYSQIYESRFDAINRLTDSDSFLSTTSSRKNFDDGYTRSANKTSAEKIQANNNKSKWMQVRK